MFCINCLNKSTKVMNSRPSKKQPVIWRRRLCPSCGITFTTYERPSLTENKPILIENKMTTPFNLGKLILSLSRSFSHAPHSAEYDTIWLAQTIEDQLSLQHKAITLESIKLTAYDILKRFDGLAAVQYAAQHHMIATTRKRGRPSWHEPEQPKHA